MCGQHGIDIWKELEAIRKLLEGFQERLVETCEPKPKKKVGRPKGSKNAKTGIKKKIDKK